MMMDESVRLYTTLHCLSIPVSWTVLLDDDRSLLFNMMDEFDRLLEINF